jgi:hypothetical protein
VSSLTTIGYLPLESGRCPGVVGQLLVVGVLAERRRHVEAEVADPRGAQRGVVELGNLDVEVLDAGTDRVEAQASRIGDRHGAVRSPGGTADRRSAAARPANRVEVVDEDDCRSDVLCLLEQIVDSAGSHADDHLDELRGRDGEERHVCLAGDSPGQQRYAGTRCAGEQGAARHLRTQTLIAVGVAREVHDLQDLLSVGRSRPSSVRVPASSDPVSWC